MWNQPLIAIAVAGNEPEFIDKIVVKYFYIVYADKNRLGPLGCRVIASAPSLQNLKSLELNQNKIKDGGVRALGTSLFEGLEDLSLN